MKWEYVQINKYVIIDAELLDAFGKDGWELVTVFVVPESGMLPSVVYIFKRPLPPEPTR